ncbi:glycosyl-transferase for dystroglycan-domain-containing protein [Lentinula edodes]|uniref:Glycosyl-transferase for dystroglycan-domain-containing protein n=1 Tax=Lentinula lateritia TaxID=40482 RepID=A0A9W9AZT9_9AGAR|nr:glycosyl-transferase for dystroglycan-domain-containing protein [Lentinula edodes]
MIVSTTHCARIGQTIALLYAFIAILYTTNYLLATPLRACFSLLFNLPTSTTLPNSSVSSILHSLNKQNSRKPQVSPLFWDTKASRPSESSWPAVIDNDLVLSKAFSSSMHPSKIVPFFYRASGELDADDITITTLITSNRFPVFARLVERYQGPISVAIHVNNNSSEYYSLLDSIHTLYTSTPNMARFVDVHLVMDSFDRQFNTWRNIARLFARTDFVMMLDIDFAICTDFRSAMRANRFIMDELRKGNSAFVIPAFEFVKPDEGNHQVAFPTDKISLLSAVKAGHLDMFHASWEVGHNSTDYPRYYAAPPGEVYKVTKYQAAYEPYIVFKKDGPPWCDERFVGYGGNKAACLFELYLSGISYYVLSDHFIVHQNHLYEEKVRKDERKFNKKIYNDFKEETCLRYFKHYHDLGILNSTRGYNIQQECTKLKGFPQIAQQILA